MSTQVASGSDDVSWTSNRKPVRSRFLQCSRHRIASPLQQKRSHGLDRFQTHSRRGAGGKNAEDEFFPDARVGSTTPYLVELRKSATNVFSSRLVSGPNAFNSNELMIALHCDMSMMRF